MRAAIFLTTLLVYSTTTTALLIAPDAELAQYHASDGAKDIHLLSSHITDNKEDDADVEGLTIVPRAKKPKKPVPAPKPPKAPEPPVIPKPVPNPPKTPTPGKPTSAGNVKPTKTQAVPSSTLKPSSTPKPTPEVSCKEIVRLAALSNTSPRGLHELEEYEISHGTYVGGMANLAKRTPKRGMACKMAFNAGEYPESDHALMSVAPVYGWQHPVDCNRMEWGNGGSFKRQASTQYEVEHILEWQLVTGFFDWMNDKHYNNKRKFDDPKKPGNKVDFCDYWVGIWKDAKAFTIPGKPIARTPLDFVRQEYPSKTNDFKNEFAWLEKPLNKPAKAEMWRNKETKGIYDDSKLTKYLNGTPKDARVLALKLKYVMGARKYQKDPVIARHLGEQKKRIGTILGQIDTELPKQNPAWQKQDLEKLWNQYMDQHFLDAKSRTDYTMNTWLPKLQNKWVKGKPGGASNDQLLRGIKAVQTEWRKEGASKWDKPW